MGEGRFGFEIAESGYFVSARDLKREERKAGARDEDERSVHSTVLLLATFSILRFHSSVPGIKLRSFATRTNENLVEKKETDPHIRISSFLLGDPPRDFGWSRRAVGKHFGYSRKIYNNHSARRTTNIQQRINRWSSAGFFLPPSRPLSPHASHGILRI